ncbi:MAG: hypothetical protein RL757_717 [Bacteroidota bacterium]|jgi:O-antigen/teichoic acid export membrane protein
MGIIQRQSIKNSIVNYVAVAIGALSTVFIYPLIEQTQLGMMQFSVNTAAMFIPFAQFGLSLTAVRFFSHFRSEKNGHNGFLFLLLAPISFMIFLICGLIYAFRIPISQFFSNDSQKFLETLPFMLGILIFSTFANFLVSHAANFNRIVVPSMLNNLLTKISQPIIVLLLFSGMISLMGALTGMVLMFFLMLMGLIAYLYWLGEWHWRPNFSFYKPGLLREMFTYSAFNTLVVASSAFATQLDRVFVPAAISFGALAIFNVGSLIAEAIDVPRKALAGIAAPLVAKSIHEENFTHVEEIYRRSALLQTVAGVFLLGGVWLCADALFDLMPKNQEAFRAGKYVILWLGLSRVLDMMTGINAEIITYSKYYKFNMISMVSMAVLNITLSFLFLKVYNLGILSPALATLSAVSMVNIWRLIFIYQKFRIQPLQKSMFFVVLFGLGSWALSWFLMSPFASFSGFGGAIFRIILGGGIFTLLFGVLVYFSNIVPDMNEALHTSLRKMGLKK